jgi:hypothetical protein
LRTNLPRQPLAHMLHNGCRVARERQRIGDAFQDGRQIADRDALGEQKL